MSDLRDSTDDILTNSSRHSLAQTLNQHPESSHAGTSTISTHSGSSERLPFRIGVAEDRNKRWRRTMEDAHAFVYDFGGVKGQGFFSIFDGHAGKHAAEWCGQHFHEVRFKPTILFDLILLSRDFLFLFSFSSLQFLLDSLINSSGQTVPDLFNKTYHSVDEKLSILADEQGSSSGCTAVTVFLRLEDEDGNPVAHANTGGIDKNSRSELKAGGAASTGEPAKAEGTSGPAADGDGPNSSGDKNHGVGLLSSFARRIRQGSHSSSGEDAETAEGEKSSSGKGGNIQTGVGDDGLMQVKGKEVRRVLYTANVGDARAVLW